MVILVVVVAIVIVHLHDIALVHHLVVEDFQVDDEVDEVVEGDGKNMSF